MFETATRRFKSSSSDHHASQCHQVIGNCIDPIILPDGLNYYTNSPYLVTGRRHILLQNPGCTFTFDLQIFPSFCDPGLTSVPLRNVTGYWFLSVVSSEYYLLDLRFYVGCTLAQVTKT